MSNTILLKRSNTAGKVPLLANVSLGELSINTTDGRLYSNKGSTSIVDLTQNDPITLSGDATGTSTNPAAGLGYSNLAVTLSTVNSDIGTWGGADGQIPTFTVNGKGLVTAAGNIAVSTVAVTGITSAGAGNITVSGTTGSVTLSLSTTGPGITTIGSGTAIPIITTDAYGRITALSSAAVSTTINLSGTSGTGSVAGGGTLTFAGTYGTTVTASGSTVTVATPQDLQTTATPTFTGLNLSANLASTSTVYGVGVYDNGIQVVSTSSGDGNLSISSGAISLPATGPGAITVGDGSTVPTVELDAYGRVIALTSNTVNASAKIYGTSGDIDFSVTGTGTGSYTIDGDYGVTVAASDSTLTIATPQDLQTTATPTFAKLTLNGNLTMAAGEIVANDLYVTGNLYASGNTTTVNATTVTTNDLYYVAAANASSSAAANGAGLVTPYAALTFSNANTAWSSNVDLRATALYDNNNRVLTEISDYSNSGGDVSVSGTYDTLDITLNTVNSTTGLFGNATYAPQVTVNAKGLTTAVANVLITPSWSNITSTPTTVAGYGITDALTVSATIDGGSF